MNQTSVQFGQIITINSLLPVGGSVKVSRVVVIKPDHTENTHLAAVISSDTAQHTNPDFAVPVGLNDLQEGELPEPCLVLCDNLLTIDKNQADPGFPVILNRKKLDEIFRKIARISVRGVHEGRKLAKAAGFRPGIDFVNYAGRVYDEKEMNNAVDASLDFYLTEGRFSEEFAAKIAEFLDIEYVLLTNSGSSANLLALSALTSVKLGDRRLKPGDEVISVAAGFPATVTPIIQNNLIPVFVDVDIPTYNVNIDLVKQAITPKTKCIFIAHTLGNPFNIGAIMEIAIEHNLWVVEDNCDAFGSKYDEKYTGTFGHLSTMSFYPAHHITTGEGGAVVTNDPMLAQIVRSFRDWGRDCYCAGGENNTCGKRFTQKFGDLPVGYDHKYVYSEIGYNLKMTDIQAAIGAAQMTKLPLFCEIRKRNFHRLYEIFDQYSDFFILPAATPLADPAWFCFIVTLKENCPFTRNSLTTFFDKHLIETRPLFAGNLIKHPGFMNKQYRVSGSLENTDFIMHNTFILGTYPGLTIELLKYIEEVLCEFMKSQNL